MRNEQRPFDLTVIDGYSTEVALKTFVKKDPRAIITNYLTFSHGFSADAIEQLTEQFGMHYYHLRSYLTKQLIKREDIIIGHDLTGDLKSLKMMHFKVVDTCQLFRRPDGRKQKLQDVVQQRLGLQFQPHVSENDAYASLFLVLDLLRRERGFF